MGDRARRLAVAVGLGCAAVGALAAPAVAGHGGFPHSAGDPGRAFELVSPPYKPAGIGVGNIYGGPTALGTSGAAAHVGDRFAVEGSYGSTVVDGPFAFANDVALAGRIDDRAGWMSRSALSRPLFSRQLTRFLQMSVATPDFDRMVWLPNGGAPIFPEMESWPSDSRPLFVSDWQGPRWELLDRTHWSQGESGTGVLAAAALSDDGTMALSTGRVHGVAGPGDPSNDRLAGRSVYLFDIGGELTDAFPSPDVVERYTLANSCAGSGADRTRIPRRLAGGLLGDQPCQPKPANRDERLISPYGASAAPAFYGTARLVPPRRVLSDDGRRAFFSAPDPVQGGNPGASFCGADTDEATKCPAQLYVRQVGASGDAVVRWLSRPDPGLLGAQQASLLGPALFEGASADGDKVFFRTTSPLTADDRNGTGAPPPAGGVTAGAASTSSWDLYMFDLAPGADPTGPGSSLTRISAGPDGPDPDSRGDGDCNNPQGSVSSNFPGGTAPAASLRFVSDDGSKAYFVCSGELPGAVVSSDPNRLTSPAGASPTSTDETNLYLYDADEPDVAQRWRFVARIPRAARVNVSDSGAGHAKVCASTGAPSASPIVADSVGRLNFDYGESQGTGCVRGTSDGAFITFWTPGRLTADDPDDGTVDIYGYDADSDELVRITRPQGGTETPHECVPDPTANEGVLSLDCRGDMGWAASTIAYTALLGVASDPETAGDRMAFFQSRSQLVAEDRDEAYDVYQWRNGELSLVTTGVSDANDGAIYRGNDVTGRNVYFATRDSLTWQDVDAVADVYVARLDSEGIQKPVEPPLCSVLADGCRPGTGSLPGSPAPATGQPGGGDAAPPARRRLAVRKLSRKARIRAARRGTLRLLVRTPGAGRLRVVAKGRLGRGRPRRLGSATRAVREAGVVRVRVRLSRAARKRLRRGRALRLRLRVAQQGARARSMTVRLPGASS